jgi:hypothetical protein
MMMVTQRSSAAFEGSASQPASQDELIERHSRVTRFRRLFHFHPEYIQGKILVIGRKHRIPIIRGGRHVVCRRPPCPSLIVSILLPRFRFGCSRTRSFSNLAM